MLDHRGQHWWARMSWQFCRERKLDSGVVVWRLFVCGVAVILVMYQYFVFGLQELFYLLGCCLFSYLYSGCIQLLIEKIRLLR